MPERFAPSPGSLPLDDPLGKKPASHCPVSSGCPWADIMRENGVCVQDQTWRVRAPGLGSSEGFREFHRPQRHSTSSLHVVPWVCFPAQGGLCFSRGISLIPRTMWTQCSTEQPAKAGPSCPLTLTIPLAKAVGSCQPS